MKGVTSITPSPPPANQQMTRLLEMTRAMVFIDNIDIKWHGDSFFEGGNINDTMPPTS